MEMSQLFDLIWQVGIPTAGGVGAGYKVKAMKRKMKNKIINSGLLEASSMDIDMVDTVRALNIIDISNNSQPVDIDDIPAYSLRRAARALDQLGGVYSQYLKDYYIHPQSARNKLYRSWGTSLYIDKRYIEVAGSLMTCRL